MSEKQRILYIEDDPDQLAMLQMYLESHLDVAVDLCSSAGGAEMMLNARCYDLVISDVNLPIVFGTEIVEKVLQRDPGQPVMLLSEYTNGKTKEEADRLGVPLQPKFSSFTSASFDEFIARVRELLAKRPCAFATKAEAEKAERLLLPPIRLVSENVKCARVAYAARAGAQRPSFA
jgi:DNA-binding NtrC family response regulator